MSKIFLNPYSVSFDTFTKAFLWRTQFRKNTEIVLAIKEIFFSLYTRPCFWGDFGGCFEVNYIFHLIPTGPNKITQKQGRQFGI